MSAVFALVIPGALTVTIAQAQQVVVESTLSAGVTATHRSGSGESSESASDEVVTQVSPGLIASVRGGNLQGSLAYSANALLYANESRNNRIAHSLSSTGRYAVLGGRVGLEATASASEQLISAFGTQGGGDTAGRDNRAQTFSYSVSPFLVGQLLGETTYQVRLGYASTRAGSTSLGSTESFTGSAGVSGRMGLVRWGLNANHQLSDSDLQDRVRSSRLFASLGYSPDVELQFTVRYGRDIEDIRSGQSRSTATWGGGAVWVPSVRTSLNVDYDRRYFGDSYSVGLSHRMARTIWSYNDSRSVQTSPIAGRIDVSAYEVFFAQFASIEPDPIKREQLVRAFLAARGIDPNGRVILGGFLTSVASVQRRQQVTVAYQGLRYTSLLSLSNGSTRSVAENSSGSGDLADGNAVRQRGMSFVLSYRLGASASVALSASTQRTFGTASRAGNEVRALAGTWSAQLSSRTSATVGVRYSSFDSDTSPYTESAVFGSLGVRF